jgi:adenylate cyclase
MDKLLRSGGIFSLDNQEKAKVKVPIRSKIIIPYLILATLLAVGAAFLITQIVFDSLEERFTNQLIETGKISSEWMVREEQRILESINLIANTTGVSAAIESGDAERLRELTFGIVVDKRDDAVEILDREGFLLLSMRHKEGGHVEEYDFAKNGDQFFAQWDFVKLILQSQPDGYSDKFSGTILADRKYYFYIAAPINNPQSELVGIVLIGKNLDRLVTEIRQETLSQITFYDFSGKILESTFIEPVELPGLDAARANHTAGWGNPAADHYAWHKPGSSDHSPSIGSGESLRACRRWRSGNPIKDKIKR